MHRNVVIDPEIAALLTPLAPEELAPVARSLSDHGCREPLIVGTMLAGHRDRIMA